jgi:hypothetical protein
MHVTMKSGGDDRVTCSIVNARVFNVVFLPMSAVQLSEQERHVLKPEPETATSATAGREIGRNRRVPIGDGCGTRSVAGLSDD